MHWKKKWDETLGIKIFAKIQSDIVKNYLINFLYFIKDECYMIYQQGLKYLRNELELELR